MVFPSEMCAEVMGAEQPRALRRLGEGKQCVLSFLLPASSCSSVPGLAFLEGGLCHFVGEMSSFPLGRLEMSDELSG